MITNQIYFSDGFFRLLNGSWIPAEFEKFMVDGEKLDEDTSIFYVFGIASYNPPLPLAGPFEKKRDAQKALDAFFMKGGCNAKED